MKKQNYAIRYKSAITGRFELSSFDSLEEARKALDYRESIGSKGRIVKIEDKK